MTHKRHARVRISATQKWTNVDSGYVTAHRVGAASQSGCGASARPWMFPRRIRAMSLEYGLIAAFLLLVVVPFFMIKS
jgi:hypothetical protein